MSITITVPNDDHVALRAMAKALEEIAVARGAPGQEPPANELVYNIAIDTSQPQLAALRLKECANYLSPQPEIDTTAQQVDSLVGASKTFTPSNEYQPTKEGENRLSNGIVYDTQTKQTEHLDVTEQAPPTTDSTGTPWDERIHSASKALNSDGTWRVRRKPKDMDEAEWSQYLRTVADELMSDRHGPDAGGETDEPEQNTNEINSETLGEIEPTVTPAGDDFHVDAGVVTEQEVAAIPAPPLPVPPVPVASPVTDEPALTFPQVMQFLTERHGRITSAQVDQIIADMGLNSIMDLNTQPEHTGPFIARVKALLGE